MAVFGILTNLDSNYWLRVFCLLGWLLVTTSWVKSRNRERESAVSLPWNRGVLGSAGSEESSRSGRRFFGSNETTVLIEIILHLLHCALMEVAVRLQGRERGLGGRKEGRGWWHNILHLRAPQVWYSKLSNIVCEYRSEYSQLTVGSPRLF